ncbi:MAG: galactose mutarotase [Propionibacteriaceae bacterium]|jgi:aldose 1-epimerase|nr:galactose mutarotase [Propionibacteriaceae bacterium]
MDNDVMVIGHDRCQAAVWTLGAALNGLWVPDRKGEMASAVLGFSSLGDRLAGEDYLGEMVGPFANRIAHGRFQLDGQTFELEHNDGDNTLHSGDGGLHRQTWEVVELGSDRVRLACLWPDGKGGFPGPIRIEVSYRVEGQTLVHQVWATTGRPTVVSVVCHPYFNLSGRLEPIHDHELAVAVASYLPVDAACIPLPEAPAEATGCFDLRRPSRLESVLASDHPQIRIAGGLDHAFVLDRPAPGHLALAAVLTHPGSGRRLTIQTDAPALQIYSGQGLDDDHISHPSGRPGRPGVGLALETEEFPDAPNRPDFPSAVLRPGQIYHRTTRWAFSVV